MVGSKGKSVEDAQPLGGGFLPQPRPPRGTNPGAPTSRLMDTQPLPGKETVNSSTPSLTGPRISSFLPCREIALQWIRSAKDKRERRSNPVSHTTQPQTRPHKGLGYICPPPHAIARRGKTRTQATNYFPPREKAVEMWHRASSEALLPTHPSRRTACNSGPRITTPCTLRSASTIAPYAGGGEAHSSHWALTSS